MGTNPHMKIAMTKEGVPIPVDPAMVLAQETRTARLLGTEAALVAMCPMFYVDKVNRDIEGYYDASNFMFEKILEMQTVNGKRMEAYHEQGVKSLESNWRHGVEGFLKTTKEVLTVHEAYVRQFPEHKECLAPCIEAVNELVTKFETEFVPAVEKEESCAYEFYMTRQWVQFLEDWIADAGYENYPLRAKRLSKKADFEDQSLFGGLKRAIASWFSAPAKR